MDEFNNNGQQDYNQNSYNQSSQVFNDQPIQFVDNSNYNGGQQQYYQYDQNSVNSSNNSALSIVSLVLGILSIIGCCGLGICLSIPAIITGIIARKKNKSDYALAGIICGSLGTIINIIALIYVWFFIGVFEEIFGYYL